MKLWCPKIKFRSVPWGTWIKCRSGVTFEIRSCVRKIVINDSLNTTVSVILFTQILFEIKKNKRIHNTIGYNKYNIHISSRNICNNQDCSKEKILYPCLI